MEKRCLVAGCWTADGDVFEVRSPYDGSVVGEALRPSPSSVEKAVEEASASFARTRKMTSGQKRRVLRRAAALLRERAEDFARTIALESGKPLRYSRGEAARAAETFTEAAEECSRLYGETIPLDTSAPGEGRIGITGWFPAGPVLAITPFNFPLNLVAHKIAPAIAAGCPVVLKPSSETPLTSLKLAELLTEAGMPGGALSVLPMRGREAEALASDGRFASVTFTGSAEVGWALRKAAWKKKVTLELGGNAAAIVHDDWPAPEEAAARVAAGGYAYSGQVCISVQRVYVRRGILEEFMDALENQVGSLRRGDPLDEDTDIGPMITEAEAQRVEGWLAEAAGAGAAVRSFGGREGAWHPPVIVTGAGRGMKVVDEEVFGPVTAVFEYDDFGDALREVNRSRFGLQAGVFARDAGLLRKAFETLEVGGVIAGDVPTFRVDRMPYGGVKDSGAGREGLRWSIREMCEERLLVLSIQG